MEPNGDTDRNSLKRPRMGSLDAEPDRPPPAQRGVDPVQEAGPRHPAVASYSSPDGLPSSSSGAWLFQDPLAGQFNLAPPILSGPPLAMNHPIYSSPSNIPNYQWLMHNRYPATIPVPPQMPASNLSIHHTQTTPNQTYISGGNIIDNSGTLNFYPQLTPSATPDPYLLQLREHASANAIHTSAVVEDQDMCVPGTRAFTLQHLQSLVTLVDSNEPDIIWMHGPAGAGKSAIMRTMANEFDKQGVLLGSFFFFRADAQRKMSAPFIPTLALQSFTSLQSTQPHIRNAIQSHPTIFSQSIRHQLCHLFETPLTGMLAAADEPKWTEQSPLVLVIDGLDECTDAKRQVEIIKAMRQLASTIRSSTNRCVKIIIASRPEKPIKDEFERDRNSTTIIELTPNDANMDHFYDTQLDKIRRDNNLPASWPSPGQMKWLKEKTSGHYSFAQISMGFLAGGDPVDRLKMLETGVVTHGLEPFEALDALYATIFRQIPPEMADNALRLVRFWLLNPYVAKTYHDVHIERILRLPLGFPSRLLSYLSSIFHLKATQYLPHHASLGDFLGDRLRSEKHSLFIDVQRLSSTVVEGLLDLCTLQPPLNEETIQPWFEFYDDIMLFVDNCKCLQHYTLPPTMPAKLDKILLSLPTMDLYAFGYCNYLLSALYKHLQNQEHPLASHISHLHTIRNLLDQICLIQQQRFSMYETIEEKGNSGLGLFGLLLTFVGVWEDVWEDVWELLWEVDKEPSHPGVGWAYGVSGILGHIIRDHQGSPDPEHKSEELLSMHTLVRQLSTIRELAHNCAAKVSIMVDIALSSDWPISLWGLLSRPIEDTPTKLRQCLSQAIEMLLDLPSQRTQIQHQISEFISCPDHATLHPHCDPCMSNLEQSQILVVNTVMKFLWQSPRGRNFARQHWMIDSQLFTRCYNALKSAQDHNNRNRFHWYMSCIGKDMLCELKRAELGDVDTPTVEELRTIVSSLHEMQDDHNPPPFNTTKPYICWVCTKGKPPPS